MKKGFTLIELLVVIGVMVLVAGIALFSIRNVREASLDNKREADLRLIQSSFARYNADCYTYPSSLPTAGSALTGDQSLAPSCESTNTYVNNFPADPDPSRNYYYNVTEVVAGKNVSYILCAALTTDNDPSSDVSGCGSCGSLACNIKFTN